MLNRYIESLNFKSKCGFVPKKSEEILNHTGMQNLGTYFLEKIKKIPIKGKFLKKFQLYYDKKIPVMMKYIIVG